jgi:hypothetical protein
MACDFPTILYALVEMGTPERLIRKPLRILRELVQSDGLHCCGSNAKIHGPGKRSDFCPYASLLAAKTLAPRDSTIPDAAVCTAGRSAAEALLGHWEQRGRKKYFLFGIGTDFQKLKFPLVWYNLLHVLEALSRYEEVGKDARFLEMVSVLEGKADDQFRFTAESMYRAYKDYDFADKKQPSPSLTAAVYRIFKRVKPALFL